MPGSDEALRGRTAKMTVGDTHFVNGHRITPPFPEGMATAMFGMGCFWGAERKFWQTPGVYSTAVGYAAGITPNPTYEEVCSGHDRAQRGRARGLRPEAGHATTSCSACSGRATIRRRACARATTPARSIGPGIYTFDAEQQAAADASKAMYQERLKAAGHGAITTEIIDAPEFYYAEDYHQQYLGKNPGGYCGLGGTGVSCPIGLAAR